MEVYNIQKLRTRYVVPFYFDLGDFDFEAVYKKVEEREDDPYEFLGVSSGKEKVKWVRTSLQFGEQDVYDFFVDEFSCCNAGSDNTKKMGCYWHYGEKTNGKSNFRLELQWRAYKKEINSDFVVKTPITDMGMYIFKTGVGLLWYEVSMDTDAIKDSETLIELQNKFKELNCGTHSKTYVQSSEIACAEGIKTQDGNIQIVLGSWIADRLKFLKVKFQATRDNTYKEAINNLICDDCPEETKQHYLNSLTEKCPNKALLYTYANFEPPALPENGIVNDAKITVYYLNNGYKSSYKASEKINSLMEAPFSNVLWSATREGSGYYAWPDEKDNYFFNRILYEKIMNDYFLLYIRGLYQSYSLMNYSNYISKFLPNNASEYLGTKDAEELSKEISEICAKINLFLVKSIVTSVSHVQHQNDYYVFLCKQLRITEDAESLTMGLESLKELQREAVEEKQRKAEKMAEEREKASDDKLQSVLTFVTLLTVISAIADSYGICSSLSNNTMKGVAWVVFWVLFAICIVFFTATIIVSIKHFKNKKDSKKDCKKDQFNP